MRLRLYRLYYAHCVTNTRVPTVCTVGCGTDSLLDLSPSSGGVERATDYNQRVPLAIANDPAIVGARSGSLHMKIQA